MYNEPTGKYTHSNIDRDIDESLDYETAIKLGLPMLGICRGAQFLGICSGSRLIQHQQNPEVTHPMITWDGLEIQVSSCHHQAVYPYEMDTDSFKILGWTTDMSKFHLDGTDREISKTPFKEVETIYFPKTKVLGVQWHPEFSNMKYEKDSLRWLNEHLLKFLNNEL
jgi:gamma-glutamyl-gamma-aminobutyrate hydrolase PuuD